MLRVLFVPLWDSVSFDRHERIVTYQRAPVRSQFESHGLFGKVLGTVCGDFQMLPLHACRGVAELSRTSTARGCSMWHLLCDSTEQVLWSPTSKGPRCFT